MSKKSTTHTKGFISFGDVTGGFKSPVGVPSLSQQLPLYTGDDSELVLLSKKVMKKDGVTKLKAIQDLVGILSTRPEHTLAEFLTFFVYCFSKLYVEDHRAIREKLCTIITTIVTTEKRLLAPHMKALIGPWWVLTGDPIEDVAQAAYGSFCLAIPPKKRQQVLVYLSGSVLNEANKNIHLQASGLCDLAITPLEEAEERLERVIVSSLAGVDKFIIALTTEQNQQLSASTGGKDSSTETVVAYKDLFTSAMWTKCLQSKFVLVRRAAFHLIATVAVHIPEVLYDGDASVRISSSFCTLLVNCLRSETNAVNLTVLLGSFVTVLTQVPSFFESTSVSNDIIPTLSYLLDTHHQLALEYLLPIAGCLPAAHVALLDRPTSDSVQLLDSMQGMCDLLQQLSDFAELKGSEGSVQSMDSPPLIGKTKSGRRNAAEKRNLAKQAQQQITRVESVILSIQADVCAVELATLLLLRRSANLPAATPTVSDAISAKKNVHVVVSQLVQSIVITIQSSAIVLKADLSSQKGNLLAKSLWSEQNEAGGGNASAKDAARAALGAIGRSLLQLQRATLMEILITKVEWSQLLWEPLASGLLDLYLVTSADLIGDEGGRIRSEAELFASMRDTASLTDCIVRTMSSVWLEESGAEGSAGGAEMVGQKLFDHATADLALGGKTVEKDILLSQLLLTLSDPSAGLSGNKITRFDAAILLSGAWVGTLVRTMAENASASRSAALRSMISAAFVDLVVFVGQANNVESARKILTLCLQENSLECVSVVCRCSSADSAFHSAWDARILEWVLNLGTNFLQSSISVSTDDAKAQVRFMLLVSAQPSCGAVASEWFALAKTRWRTGSGNRLAEWFILSLVAVALKQKQSQRTSKAISLPAALVETVTAWLEENPSALPDHLRRLFFARLRHTHDPNQRAKRSENMQLIYLNDVNVIMSWNDVHKAVLPVLTSQLRLDLYSTIATSLNSSLALPDSRLEDEATAEGVDTSFAVSEPQTTGLHPKKWSRNACALLSAQQSTAGVESIALFSPEFWMKSIDGVLNGSSASEAWTSQKCLTFAVECVHWILEEDEADSDGHIGRTLIRSHLTNHPMLLFWSILATKHCARVLPMPNQLLVGTTEGLLLQLFSCVSSDLRAPFFEKILQLSLENVNSEHQLRDLCDLSTKTLLEKEFVAKLLPRHTIRLQFPNIRRDERPALGSPGQYLSWRPVVSQGDSRADGSVLTKIAPIACKLAAVHREAGSDPYFTISMDQTGDAQIAHELQVEWPKILIGRNLPPSHADLVWTVPSVDSLITRSISVTKFASPVLETCVQWLEGTLHTIANEVNRSPSMDGRNAHYSGHLLAWYTDVLCALCDHLLDAPSVVKEQFEERVIARVRGVVLFLLSPACAVHAYPARITGLLLLRALLRSPLGTGAGLWIPLALSHVRNIAFAVTTSATTFDDEQVGNIISFMVSALAQMLSVISDSNVCVDCAEAFLPTALAALPSPTTALASNMLLLLAAVWRHRSETRDGKLDAAMLGDLQAWETEGFDFSVFVMVEGLTGQPERVRMDACSAVHFCLLKRSRRSCKDLMLPSLVSRFLDQLQRIAVCNPTGVNSTSIPRISDSTISNTLRVTSCKVLDAFEASKSDVTTGGNGLTEVELTDTTSEISLQEQERLEVEQDGRFLNKLVGAVYFAELSRRLIVTEADISRDGNEIAGSAEDGEDELGDGTATPCSESQSNARSVSRKVSKRATLHHLVYNDPLGSVLLWLLLLQSIDARAVDGWTVRARCVNYLKSTGMSSNILFLLIRLSGDMLKFRDVSALLQRVETIQSAEIEDDVLENRPRKQADQAGQNATGNIAVGSLQHLAVYALFRTVCALPAMFRTFWSDDCTRVQKTRLSKFVEERVRESLMKREVALIAASSAAGRWDSNDFAVRGSVVSGEVTAVLSKEETTVEIKVKLPPSYPLKNVEVTCTSRIGVSDGRWRRWVLQVIQLLGMQDGSVVDAVLMWKCNIEKELEGVEPCPICYCTLHTKTLSLPSMACPTCNNKFHSPCLSTWFKSSGKSKCVICQQPFFN